MELGCDYGVMGCIAIVTWSVFQIRVTSGDSAEKEMSCTFFTRPPCQGDHPRGVRKSEGHEEAVVDLMSSSNSFMSLMLGSHYI